MFSFLEIDKSNLTNLSKDKNKSSIEEESQEEVAFSKIFNDLIEDKEAVKKKGKNLEKKAINLLLKEKNIADVDKEEIKEEPIIETKEGNIAFKKEYKKIIKTTKESLEIAIEDKPTKKAHSLETLRSVPQNAKELLQMAKEAKSPKTIKDVLQKANDLNLNVKKINFQEELQKTNKASLQEIFEKPKSKDVKGLKREKISTSDKVLSNLLQDKKILENGKKVEKSLLPKQEKIKETPTLGKELKNPKNTQAVKEEVKIVENPKKEAQHIIQEKIIPTLVTKEEKKEVLRDSKASLNPKEPMSENLLQDKKILENGKKVEKSLLPKQEKIKETPTLGKELKNPKNTQAVKEEVKIVENPKKEAKHIIQEKIIPTLVTKEEKKEVLRDSKASLNPKEPMSETPKNSNFILESPLKTATKPIKESLNKQERLKTSLKEEKNPYSSIKKERKTIKEDKAIDKPYQKQHFALQEEKQNIQNIIKEEMQTKEGAQQNFLDNLLKMQHSLKSSLTQETKEASLTQKEIKEKSHQEVYQSAIQSQNTERFSVQNTFAHFSDKLKEALQNYRPPVTKISLELDPQNLGNVELTITKRGDNIHIQIGSNQQALQLFMQNAQDFKNQLSSLGFNEVQMDFKDTGGNSLGGGFSDSNGGSSQQNSHQNSQNNQKRNENGLYVYQQADDSYREISYMDLSFSYDA
ncbi:flagellar hook-length control protein FliK [Helicobacter mesocricetorum]|uniref:flagellar hook-length control protein FliK n=1 Tax=Helicobacter mesocricetorum TaxID=87012 RepID=UPI000CF0A428|nr:flagellar hook-length control protein FliK [Helicobacter mesocricetorum]